MALPDVLVKYAGRLGFTDSTTTGYKALEKILEWIYLDKEDRIKVLNALPGTPQEIIQKSGLPEEEAMETIRTLMTRGGLAWHSRKPGRLAFPANIGNLKELNANWPDAPRAFHELMDVLFYDEIHKDSEMLNFVKLLDSASVVRVLPVEETLKAESKIMDVDSARSIFDGADLITAVPCGCRVQAKENHRGEGCPAPVGVNTCFQTNAHAARIMERDIGWERLSTEEARRRLGLTEDAGLVHMVANVVPKDKSYILCNCCSCCCAGLYWINSGYGGVYAPSRFSVRLDADGCSGCGLCAERCQFKLIRCDDAKAPIIRTENCYGCGNCVTTCPDNALRLEEVRSRDHIHEEDTYFS